MLESLEAAHKRPLNEFEQGLRKLTWVLLLAALVFPTLVRLVVLGVWWLPDFTVFLRAVGMDPMNASGFSSIFVLFLGALPRRALLAVIVGLGVLLEAYYIGGFLPSQMSLFQKFLASGGGFAIAGLIGLALQAALPGATGAKQRAGSFLRVSIILALYPYSMAAVMGSLSQMTPMVYDSHAYLVEGSLGFHLSFQVANFLVHHPGLSAFFELIYSRLPVWVVIALLANVFRYRKCTFNLFLAYVISGIGAVGFYYFIPMVGIDYYLGSPTWPMGPLPDTVKPILHPAPPDLPRSCLPSMHACWILLPYFCVRRVSKGWSRFYLFLVLTTLVAAMRASIGHYSIDFVASFPYALAVIALTTRGTEQNTHWRWKSLAFGVGATLGCVLALRWFGPGLAYLPWFTWPMMAWVVVASFYLENRLARATLERSQ